MVYRQDGRANSGGSTVTMHSCTYQCRSLRMVVEHKTLHKLRLGIEPQRSVDRILMDLIATHGVQIWKRHELLMDAN